MLIYSVLYYHSHILSSGRFVVKYVALFQRVLNFVMLYLSRVSKKNRYSFILRLLYSLQVEHDCFLTYLHAISA